MNYNAILLIGPTGSGKTPFGDYITSKKLFNKVCFHFDFGANLRMIKQLHDSNRQKELKNKFSLLGDQELSIIIESLRSGTLLEDDQFYIAKDIFLSFVAEKDITVNDLIVMNGLPRHTGQAAEIDKFINITGIIYLNCTDAVVYNRIHKDPGGDRAERNDDSMEEVKNKLGIFKKRTLELIEYYREKAVKVFDIRISEYTLPNDIFDCITIP